MRTPPPATASTSAPAPLGRTALAALAAFALAGVAPTGCTNATGGVSGGDPLVADPCAGQTTHTWTDLYACYFGPMGKASCSAQSFCHGTAGADGTAQSGFLCGGSQEACWKGMTAAGSIVPSQGSMKPTQTLLYGSLRKALGGSVTGTMPCNPETTHDPDGGSTITCSADQGSTFAFTQSDLDRITAWIEEGAQDN
jgi:hypothetical protein